MFLKKYRSVTFLLLEGKSVTETNVARGRKQENITTFAGALDK